MFVWFLRHVYIKDTFESKRFIFFWIELNSIRFGGNVHKSLRRIGKPRITYCQCYPDRNNAASHATPGWQPPSSIDECDGVHGRVRAAASLCFVLEAQARTPSLSASLGWAKKAKQTPRTEQRRRCSYHWSLLELSSVFSVAWLDCRGTWPIELAAKLGLRPQCSFLRRHRRGTLCYDL